MCGETNVTLQTHQILRLPRKMTMQHLAEICEKQLKRHFQCAADPRMIRARSDHVPRPFASVRNPPRNRGYFSRSRRTVCIEKYNISRSGYLSKFHQVLRLPRKVTLELHQVLRLPRKVTLDLHQVLRLPHRMTRRLDPRHIWNVISNVRRNKCHTPNSPNTAPATQNDHATSGRNLRKTAETSFPMRGRSENDPSTLRSRSETVCVSPQPATQQRLLFALQTNGLYWKIQHFALRLSFQISPSTAPTTKSNTWTSPSTAPTTKSDTWPSPSTAPATQNDSHAWSSSHMKRHFQCAQQHLSPSNFTKYCACHAKWSPKIWQKFAKNSWNVISNARPIREWSETVPTMNPSVRNPPRNRGYFSRSGRAFRIEKYNISRSGYLSKFHQVLRLPRKVTLDLHQVLRLPRKVTLDLHQVLRLPRKVTLELHQVLRLPRKMTRMLDPRHIWNVISNARSNICHPPTSPNTAPVTQNDHPKSDRNLQKTAETSFPMRGRSENDPRPFRPWTRQSATRHATEVTFRAPDERFVLKNTTFRAPAIFPNFTKYCAYHEKWHLNFTKYCACQEKWHLNFTKYCAYHAKWHLNFTKYCAYHAKWHLNFTKYCAYHAKWHLNFTKYCAYHEK